MILENQKLIKMLEKDGDKIALNLKKERMLKRKKDKQDKKRKLRLGDPSHKTCLNKHVGDRRFHENYRCDWKLKLMDREKELAHQMSKDQFRDSTSQSDQDKTENERDMGSHLPNML